jgi:hypothetical protein
VLNAGLMRLISTCLLNDGGGPVSRRVSVAGRRSLFSLSESAAAEAINALDELRQRLVAASTERPPSALLSPRRQPNRNGRSTSRSSVGSKDKPIHQENQRAGERPGRPKKASSVASRRSSGTSNTSLKRNMYNPPANGGAWVRSRKDSSVTLVTTAVSHRPKKPAQANRSEPVRSSTSKKSHSYLSPPPLLRLPDGEIDFRQFSRPLLNPATSVVDERMNHLSSLTARSPLIPLAENLQPPRLQPPPQSGTTQTPHAASASDSAQDSATTAHRFSIMSFSSDSTKLGEIPPHRWPVPYVPPPAILFPGPVIEAGYKAKPKTGLRFWKRFGRGRTSPIEAADGGTA